MKDFLKNVLATLVGLVLFVVILFFVAGVGIGAAIATSEKSTSLADNSVLVLNMKGDIVEQSSDMGLPIFAGADNETMGMNDILSAIKKAKNSDQIKGIYIENNGFSADFSQLQEIRDALADFKKSKKWVIAYGDAYGSGSYYLASVADKVYMNPQGSIEWTGLAAVKIYVKDLLAKVGVRFVPLKVGKYKSAIEALTSDKMSDPDREQTTAFTQGTWNAVVDAVSKSRGISPLLLNQYADSLIELKDPQVFLQTKMVDGLLYADQMKETVMKKLGVKDDDDIHQVGIADMAAQPEFEKGDNEIAVYYASGDIVDEENPATLYPSVSQIAARTVCKDLEDLMDDDDVKAVVIRINSGGGDAFASEKIWRQVNLLRQKKPVVVSMSGYAASGAYYMSCPANWIVAEPLTITGSIGIFGQIPDFNNLLTQKLSIKYDQVLTNKHSDVSSPFKSFSPEELSMLQGYIQHGYNLFVKRVADGRHLTLERVNEIGQGHVYLAQDALKLKLVDELGGLDKAVDKAAKLAKCKKYYTADYPETLEFLDQLMEASPQSTYLDKTLRETMGDFYAPFVMISRSKNMGMVQARLPFYLYYN